MQRSLYVASALLALAAHAGCGSKSSTSTTSSDSTSYASEAGIAEANSAAQASESTTAVGFMEDEEPVGFVRAIPRPRIKTACLFSSIRSACSSNADTITWSGCTVYGGRFTMSGGWTETFSGTGASTCTVPVADGGSVNRRTASGGSTITSNTTSNYITTDTDGGTAYDGTTIPSTGTTVSNTGGTRTIAIGGTHRVAKTSAGTKIFEHYLTGTLSVTGRRSTSNRVVTGTMTVYHQLAQYTAALTYNSVTWGDSSCCFPTSGSISATLTGSVSGSTSLTFSTTCGEATFVDTTGASSTATLSNCQ